MKRIPALFLTAILLVCCTRPVPLVEHPADYVSTLVGTQSDFTLSTGNTYPAPPFPGA